MSLSTFHKTGKITYAIADDHKMLRKGIVTLLQMNGRFDCIFDVDNGDDVVFELKKNKIPDILILDINLGNGLSGTQVATWVTKHYPLVRILALSMHQDELSILKMIQAGARGYITKSADSDCLVEAIEQVYKNGAYMPANLSLQVFQGIRQNVLAEEPSVIELNDREKLFLSLLCKEMTYQQIAEQMFLSPRTIDDYRKKLVKKLSVKGKSGLIMYALKNGFSE